MTDAELFEIRQAFSLESSELRGEMEAALLALEDDIGNQEEFNRLFRAVHTIKGSASIVGYGELEQFCHCMEHILVRIREQRLHLDQPLISLMLACHDHIRVMISLFCSQRGASSAPLPESHLLLLDRLAAWESASSAPSPGDNGAAGGTPGADPPDPGADVPLPAFGLFDDLPVAGQQPRIPLERSGTALQQPPPSRPEQDQRAIRVDAAKLDQLADLVVELVTASSVLETQVTRLGDLLAIETTAHVASLVKQIQEKSMVFRMVPVQTLFQRFQRIVHDGGKAAGKEIRLVISGGETELDKAVAEKLYEPLLHLVRNAIDHGIETAQERSALGKPATGTVHLQASQEAGSIIICVTDDGRGIDLERVARKGMELGLLKRDGGAGGRDLLSCIFEPGFSTLDEATTLSGRGVGMDVVKKAIESLRGRIDPTTGPGTGTTFRISIPLSLSLVDGFMVGLGNGLFILPMEQVQETLELPDITLPGVFTNNCLRVREQPLPCLDLNRLLCLPAASDGIRHVVVVRYGGKRVGLVVESLFGEVKAVIKPLGPLFRGVRCISGASILGNGSIALFLETEWLIASAGPA